MNRFDWVWSDTHFGHKNIIEYSKRPFNNVGEMDKVLIQNFRNFVKPEDTVLWLGDCFFGTPEYAALVLSWLPGTHILVRGNHDRSASAMARIGFAAVVDGLTLHAAKHTVRAAHKPAPVGKGEICLHGHTHQTTRRVDNQVHVGVDAWDYKPVSYVELCRIIEEK